MQDQKLFADQLEKVLRGTASDIDYALTLVTKAQGALKKHEEQIRDSHGNEAGELYCDCARLEQHLQTFKRKLELSTTPQKVAA